jgi:hypothetical protein
VAAHALVVAGVPDESRLPDLLGADDGEGAQTRAGRRPLLQEEVDDPLLLDVPAEHAPVHVQRRRHRPVHLPGVPLHEQDEPPHAVLRQALQLFVGGSQPPRPGVVVAADDEARDAGALCSVKRRTQRQGAAPVVVVVRCGVVEVSRLEGEAAPVHALGERLEVAEQLVVGDVPTLRLLNHGADAAQQPLQPLAVHVPGAAGQPQTEVVYQEGEHAPDGLGQRRRHNNFLGEVHRFTVTYCTYDHPSPL